MLINGQQKLFCTFVDNIPLLYLEVILNGLHFIKTDTHHRAIRSSIELCPGNVIQLIYGEVSLLDVWCFGKFVSKMVSFGISYHCIHSVPVVLMYLPIDGQLSI